MPSPVPAPDAFWQQPITKQLQQQLSQFKPRQNFLVACSGGRDSLSLARALQLLCPGRVRVVHVDHQLQQPSAQWASWLDGQCRQWDLPCLVLAVQVQAGNVEAAARKARYQALFAQLKSGEILVLGHHQQDQAETVFLRLMSGSGVKGLAAMQLLEQRQAEQHQNRWLWRPWLMCSRQQITQLAELITPEFIDDPANSQDNFDRVFLRQQVWPLLKPRWPALDRTLGRSAALMQDCADILQEVLAQDWQQCGNDEQLNLIALADLTPARQRLLLSRWMQGSAQYAPAFHLVEQLQQRLIAARQDAAPKIEWQDWQFRRYQHSLFRLPKQHQKAMDQVLSWPREQSVDLPSGTWQWRQQDYGFPLAILDQPWQLQTRRGGEILHLHGRVGRWPLKKSLQSAGLTPWQREQVHLLLQQDVVYGVLTAHGFWPVALDNTDQPATRWVANGWLPEQIA